jgi:phosphatidylserine/phosphatidylglycerophosphate/cardiolipin synthase-like enzyme
VDNRSVLVSSINWNSNSPNFNRETGVIIESTKAAQYFKEVFEDDWKPVRPKTAGNFDYLKIAGLIAVLAVLIILFVWRQRRV